MSDTYLSNATLTAAIKELRRCDWIVVQEDDLPAYVQGRLEEQREAIANWLESQSPPHDPEDAPYQVESAVHSWAVDLVRNYGKGDA